MKTGLINYGKYKSIIGIEFLYFNNTIYIYRIINGYADELNPKKSIEYIESFKYSIPEEYINNVCVRLPEHGNSYNGSIYVIDDNYSDLFISSYLDMEFQSTKFNIFINHIKGIPLS